jgi:hypothetical protein
MIVLVLAVRLANLTRQITNLRVKLLMGMFAAFFGISALAPSAAIVNFFTALGIDPMYVALGAVWLIIMMSLHRSRLFNIVKK